ncbi:MAG: glycosyltransferase [Planctomycetes bacterium]|nr:glycosyltransferase [Planctomycetota bacterium]
MPRRLAILLVANGYPPESVGGVEQHVQGLARCLAERGHRVQVYARSGRADGEPGTLVEERIDGIPVTRVVYRYEGNRDLRDLYTCNLLDAAFTRHLAGRSFDVAHVHHFSGISTGIVRELRTRALPCVLTLHDYWLLCPRGQMWHPRGERCEQVELARCTGCLRSTWPQWPPGGPTEAMVGFVHEHARAVFEDATAVVVPSARALAPFRAAGLPAARVHVVENGVDVAALAGIAPPTRAAGAPLRVGYLGSVIPSKGLAVLIEALHALPSGRAELHVHGNAFPYFEDATYLERALAAMKRRDAMTYHGAYAAADLPGILAGLDVVAVPALWNEVFGLTAREAMAAGRAVVASRVGGLQDALEDGRQGLLVPPGDAQALAAALHRLALDPELVARLGRAGRTRVRSLQAMTDELATLYAGLCRT